MAGLNLSQALEEKQARAHGQFFDKSFFMGIIFLAVTFAVFGGVRWYLAVLERNLANVESEIASKTATLEKGEARRVADLRDRLDTITTHLATTSDPATLFANVESVTLPSVRLTTYEEDWEKGAMTLEGVTDNLKFVAQTMLALKRILPGSEVSVDSVTYDDTGKVEFRLMATTTALKK